MYMCMCAYMCICDCVFIGVCVCVLICVCASVCACVCLAAHEKLLQSIENETETTCTFVCFHDQILHGDITESEESIRDLR